MAISSPSFYLSEANTEFAADGYATNIMSKAGVATPAYLSVLAGMSALTVLNAPPSNIDKMKGTVGLLFNLSGGNIYWYKRVGTVITSAQFTTGAGKLRLSVYDAANDAGIIFTDATENTTFTVDATKRGVELDMGSAVYDTWADYKVELFDLGGTLKGTWIVTMTVTD